MPTPPEIVTNDSTCTWPPRIVLLAMMTRSPSTQSWATCTLTIRKLLEPIRVRPCFFLAAAVDGHAFAEDVVIADLDAGRAALVRDVLGLAADDGERVNDVVLAQRGQPGCRHGRSAGYPGRS